MGNDPQAFPHKHGVSGLCDLFPLSCNPFLHIRGSRLKATNSWSKSRICRGTYTSHPFGSHSRIEVVKGYLFLALTVLATTLGQLSFKKCYISHQRIYQLIAVVLFILVVPCTYLAVRQLGIGRVYIGAAASYVLAPVLARQFFHDKINGRQWIALALILSGVIIYNT